MSGIMDEFLQEPKPLRRLSDSTCSVGRIYRVTQGKEGSCSRTIESVGYRRVGLSVSILNILPAP
jgi:hypothetical protein